MLNNITLGPGQVLRGVYLHPPLHHYYYGEGGWELLKYSLEKVMAPTTAGEINLTKEQMLEALIYAKRLKPNRHSTGRPEPLEEGVWGLPGEDWGCRVEI